MARGTIIGGKVWALALWLWAALPAAAEGPEVELLLVLAIDVSASVNDGEYDLQRLGTARAFRDPAVRAALAAAPGGIAVAVVQWSSIRSQAVGLDWTRLADPGAVEAFAARLEAMPRRLPGGNTMIHAGLDYAAGMFDSAPVVGRRRVIDLAGNGTADDEGEAHRVRDRLVAEGIVINGLAIEEDSATLTRYFRENVIGGPGSFVITAADFHDFERAMQAKLLREIGHLPVSALRPPTRTAGAE